MKRQALVVGINRYPCHKNSPKSPAAHLKTAASDAKVVARMLELYGNFEVKRLPSKSDISQLDEKEVIRAEELQQAITELFNPQENIPNTALLYFAGHGWREIYENGETEGFLATSDLNPRRKKYGVSLKWLRQLLQNSCVQQQIVWLDCGYSGELFNFNEREIGTGLTHELWKNEPRRNEGHEEGQEVKRVSESSCVSPIGNQDRCWITATQASERANTIQGRGVLTQALVSSLEPNQDDGGRRVTSDRIIEMIEERVRNNRFNQNPMFYTTGAPIILTGIRGTRWNYQHRLEHLWSETADWFSIGGQDLLIKHTYYHISNYFFGNSRNTGKAQSYKAAIETALEVTFPDDWWKNQKSIENLHESLKCLCGAVFCGQNEFGDRHITIGSAYLIALMAYADVFGNTNKLTDEIDLSQFKQLDFPLFPLQEPEQARLSAKALYDLFFCLFEACQNKESEFRQIFFNKEGNKFTIEFTRGADEPKKEGGLSLAEKLPRMLGKDSVPTPKLTNTTSAILRLWRCMLISKDGFMSPGTIYMEKQQLIVSSSFTREITKSCH
ncbi:caspase family protein [Nodularia sphaerocarpa]|uniref:caspase family protein n=1 Tax=Nodularia sphaerocarpa TaxID=137816 RepID=UPI001EFB5401|nr:caspase family protein [Nodularia sphaerocarpa]MDB9375790.1 caspase family protein [Nodularia sphaerocarpa CS-585]MDB9378123.1 caspase family protein [Nodularia sphaerocarpa CS-585A2]ULP71893.1 hypothetical protein BDGGKGIB_01530 [Nodularia sphaerocarpa UHCC 0038]